MVRMQQDGSQGTRPPLVSGMYKSFHHGSIRQGAEVLASARQFGSITELKAHLADNLPQNSADSRSRYAFYMTHRFFSDGQLDKPLTRFAEKYRGTRSLQLVTFYAMCKAETIVRDVVAEVLYPCLDAGYGTKHDIVSFMQSALNGAPSAAGQVRQITQVLRYFNLVKIASDHSTISVWAQPPDLPALTYVLHDLFTTPGMYAVRNLVLTPEIRSLLWTPEIIRGMLRDMHKSGLLAKLSSTDDHEHFTTVFTLDEVVERLTL